MKAWKSFGISSSSRRVFSKSRVLVFFARSNKEVAHLTREGYLQEELLTDHIVLGYLNHTIYMSTLTFHSFLSLSVAAGFYGWRLVLKRLRWKSCTCVCLLSLI